MKSKYGDLISVRDAAIYLGIKPNTLYKRIYAGKVSRPIEIGPASYFERKYVETLRKGDYRVKPKEVLEPVA